MSLQRFLVLLLLNEKYMYYEQVVFFHSEKKVKLINNRTIYYIKLAQ